MLTLFTKSISMLDKGGETLVPLSMSKLLRFDGAKILISAPDQSLLMAVVA